MKNGNGEGSVYKLSGRRRKPWAVRITLGFEVDEETGKCRQLQKYIGYFAKRSEAVAFLADYNRGKVMPESYAGAPTFQKVYEGWYNWKWNRQNRPGDDVFRDYDTFYKKMAHLGPKKINAITLFDLQAVIDNNRNLSKSSMTKIMTVMHGMYKYAVDHDYIQKDLSHRVTVEYNTAPTRRHTVFTDSEIRKLIEMDSALPLLMIFTGVRISEIGEMRLEDIHDDYMVGGLKTKAGRGRIIPLPEPIRKYIRPQGKAQYLERNDGGKMSRPGYIKLRWEPEMLRVGMDHLPHDTRHTCATLMERAGVPMLHRKLILGHAITDITEGVYTHVKTADLLQSMEKVCRLFF